MTALPRPPPSAPADTRWLVTFADLISLLLTFFVMLFAMSSVKEQSWSLVVNALSQSLNPVGGWDDAVSLTDRTVNTEPLADAADLDYLYAVLVEKTRRDPVLARALLNRLDDRLIIALPSDLLFAPARAELSGEARDALAVLGETLENIGNRIDINGYADPRRITGGDFASNWELSTARALAVADALRAAGYTRRIVTLGSVGSGLSNLLAATPRADRLRLARRVDVVIRESYMSVSNDGP